MARIDAVPLDEATPEVKEIFADIERHFGMIPLLFRVAAHSPPLLRTNWEKVKAMMMTGVLSRKLKESIAVLVSKDNGCKYCLNAHLMALKAMGVTPQTLDDILEADLFEAGFCEREAALINFARMANSDPQAISDGVFQQLKEVGATDIQIVEALGVMELFAGFNRFLDTLDILVEP